MGLAGKTSGKRSRQSKPAGWIVGVVDQRIAVDDVAGERGERLALGGRANPEGELRDLDRFGREIDAVQVLVEDEVRAPASASSSASGASQLVEVADDFVVAVLPARCRPGTETRRSRRRGRRFSGSAGCRGSRAR